MIYLFLINQKTIHVDIYNVSRIHVEAFLYFLTR